MSVTDEWRDATGHCVSAISVFPGNAPLRDTSAGPGGMQSSQTATQADIAFDRHEIRALMNLYGRKVAAGEWRDYAMDFLRDRAVFSVFRRSAEYPIYRIEKNPKLARRQGAYAVLGATGQILKRGHELDRVLRVLDKPVKLVVG
jgi:hypothetical protein